MTAASAEFAIAVLFIAIGYGVAAMRYDKIIWRIKDEHYEREGKAKDEYDHTLSRVRAQRDKLELALLVATEPKEEAVEEAGPKVNLVCAECQDLFLGHDDFLCEKCRG